MFRIFRKKSDAISFPIAAKSFTVIARRGGSATPIVMRPVKVGGLRSVKRMGRAEAAVVTASPVAIVEASLVTVAEAP